MPYGASITKRKQSLLKFSVKELTENEKLLQKHHVSYLCFHVCSPLETFLRKYYVSSSTSAIILAEILSPVNVSMFVHVGKHCCRNITFSM